MIKSTRSHWWVRVASATLLVGTLMGCDDPLTVDDPLTILEERVNNPVGADLLRRNARAALSRFTGETAWESGLITDEFFYQQDAGTDIQIFPFDNQQLIDKRASLADQE